MNMLASADIFELILGMLSMQTSDLENIKDIAYLKDARGGNKMVELYVTLILKGKKTINDVPSVLRTQVEAMLKEIGA